MTEPSGQPPPEPPEPPICPVNRLLKETEFGDECKRRWFPKKHKWVEVRDSGVYSYQQCSRCLGKKIVQYRKGYQPIAIGWEDVYNNQNRDKHV